MNFILIAVGIIGATTLIARLIIQAREKKRKKEQALRDKYWQDKTRIDSMFSERMKNRIDSHNSKLKTRSNRLPSDFTSKNKSSSTRTNDDMSTNWYPYIYDSSSHTSCFDEPKEYGGGGSSSGGGSSDSWGSDSSSYDSGSYDSGDSGGCDGGD